MKNTKTIILACILVLSLFALLAYAAAPTIVLNSPASAAYISSATMTYTFTATVNPNITSCNIMSNTSGTFKINDTFDSILSGVSNSSTINIPADGNYIWNVNCSDSLGNGAFAESPNRTFTIDTVLPAPIRFLSPTNNSYSSDSTPFIQWNKTTDVNFANYVLSFSPYVNMSDPTKTETITSIDGNATTLSNIETDGTYYLQVQAFDSAGSSANSTVLYFNLDTETPSASSDYPITNSFTADSTQGFNVTMNASFPSNCTLLLTKKDAGVFLANATDSSIADGENLSIRPSSAMDDGVYQWIIECANKLDAHVNITGSSRQITVDTTLPTNPYLVADFHQKNNTDRSPYLKWVEPTEANFSYYLAQAYYINNGSLASQTNITTKTTLEAILSLTAGLSYNFSVTAFDLAGNFNSSSNTTLQTTYYVDSVCGILNAGWNMCGAVWTTSKSLGLIANETGAQQVAVWNQSHQFATCNSQVSATGQHCAVNVNIAANANHVVFIYVNTSTQWENRTWVAVASSANIYTTNASGVGWNAEASIIRNGRVFGHIKNQFLTNESQWSMPYNNGTTMPYVNNGLFRSINNRTNWDYGRAMWIFHNGTSNTVNATEVPLANSSYPLGGW